MTDCGNSAATTGTLPNVFATLNSGGGGTITFNQDCTGANTITLTGTLTITNSTLSGNGATIAGAIYNGATLTLTLSVVAGNTARFIGPDLRGPVTTDGGGNVVGNSNPADITDGSSGITNGTNGDKAGSSAAPLDAKLGPLANNGGPVPTQALLPGSPAIDIAACPIDPITNMTLTTDARGVSRSQGANCDAGAYEARAFRISNATGDGQSAAINTPFGSAVGLTLAGTMGDPVAGGQVTFTITPGTGGAFATFSTLAGCTVSAMNTVAVCTVPISGIVTNPTLTANGTPGAFTILATAASVPTTTFNETNIGPAVSFTVTGCPAPVLSGTPCTVTVTAKDASGNTATGYGGTVKITSSDLQAVLPANAMQANATRDTDSHRSTERTRADGISEIAEKLTHGCRLSFALPPLRSCCAIVPYQVQHMLS